MASPLSAVPDADAKLLEQYGCGPIPFVRTTMRSTKRHLVFDNVVGLTAAGPRERVEAFAARCGTSSRNDGFTPRKRRRERTRSGCTTFR